MGISEGRASLDIQAPTSLWPTSSEFGFDFPAEQRIDGLCGGQTLK